MPLELPERLHATRDLLMRSLIPTHAEQAPEMPTSLALDLTDRFAPRRPTAPDTRSLSWLQKARHFLATPTFGAVAAAIALLGAALPLLQNHAALPGESLRGTHGALANEAIPILFVGQHPDVLQTVLDSGLFEASNLSSASSLAEAEARPGAKVIVDLSTSTITAITKENATVQRVAVPTSPDNLADAIAFAVSSL